MSAPTISLPTTGDPATTTREDLEIVVNQALAEMQAGIDGNTTTVSLLIVTENTNLDNIRERINELGEAVVFAGNWAPTTGAFPATADTQTGTRTLNRGDMFKVIGAGGVVDGVDFKPDDFLVASITDPSTTIFDGNWTVFRNNFDAEITAAITPVSGELENRDRLIDGGIWTTDFATRVITWTGVRVFERKSAAASVGITNGSLTLPTAAQTTRYQLVADISADTITAIEDGTQAALSGDQVVLGVAIYNTAQSIIDAKIAQGEARVEGVSTETEIRDARFNEDTLFKGISKQITRYLPQVYLLNDQVEAGAIVYPPGHATYPDGAIAFPEIDVIRDQDTGRTAIPAYTYELPTSTSNVAIYYDSDADAFAAYAITATPENTDAATFIWVANVEHNLNRGVTHVTTGWGSVTAPHPSEGETAKPFYDNHGVQRELRAARVDGGQQDPGATETYGSLAQRLDAMSAEIISLKASVNALQIENNQLRDATGG